MERYGILYKITNKINNKIYIGVTKKTFNQRYSANGVGIERVLNYYLANKKTNNYINKHLVRAIKKYGFEAWEIIEEFDIAYSKEELLEKEIFWIQFYDSNNFKYGYNRSAGGENTIVAKGKDHPKYNSITFNCEICGKVKTQNPSKYNRNSHHYCSHECRQIGISVHYSGENNKNNKRITIICEYCKTLKKKSPSLAKDRNRNYCSKECQNEHQKTTLVGKNNPNYGNGEKITGSKNGRAKKVICITTGEIFDCMLDGANKYGTKNSYIGSNCNGKQKSAGKLDDGTPLVWKYYEEDE